MRNFTKLSRVLLELTFLVRELIESHISWKYSGVMSLMLPYE